MPIDLYYLAGSPPCGAVLLTAKTLGIDVNIKIVDLAKGEQMLPEYLKMNPQHTVPTLDDNGLYLTESRAIMTYLANQYAKNDSLYPKDPKKRALVDQRLYFDMGMLFNRFEEYYYPKIYGGEDYKPAKLVKCQEGFQFLNTFLSSSIYAAGNTLTLADLSLLVTVTTYQAVKFDLSPYSNVTKWLARVQREIPNYEEAYGKCVPLFAQWYADMVKGTT